MQDQATNSNIVEESIFTTDDGKTNVVPFAENI